MRLPEQDRKLTGRVEIDDTYLGGQPSGGMAAAARRMGCLPRGADHRGRPATTKEAVGEFSAQSMVQPLTVVSDRLGCFAASLGAADHRTVAEHWNSRNSSDDMPPAGRLPPAAGIPTSLV